MWKEGDEEPASPNARLMQAQKLNICIISVLGYNTIIDPNLFKKCLEQTLIKHPRFASILVKNGGKCRWKQTRVDVENHVFEVDLDPDMESADEFVEDYVSNLSKIPMDLSKPLWEFHILNVKTSDAKSTVFFKIHHSMGDGVSLMALTHACSKSLSNPDSLPVFPSSKKHEHEREHEHKSVLKRLFVLVWTFIMIVYNTLLDVTMFVATILFLEDSITPVKDDGDGGGEPSQMRFVHRVVSLDDVKLVKTALNTSINDVLLGITEAGLSRYLNERYGELHSQGDGRENGAEIIKKVTNYLPRSLRFRSTVVFNLRPSPTIEDLAESMEKEELNRMWGNNVSIGVLPFTIELQEDPLIYIRRIKSTMDRKKLSLGQKCLFFIMKLTMSLFGVETSAGMIRTIFKNTTLTFSNVMGPKEEVNLFGHHLSYMAPSVCGFPQALAVLVQTYSEKLIISIGADEKFIPNPYQLCDDLVMSLQNIKETVIERGLFVAYLVIYNF